MMKRVGLLGREERGMTIVFVSFGCFAFLAATMLAIDLGLLFTAHTQAQTSADAGALAGATALVYNSFTDHSNTGPAKTNAVNTAQANLVISRAPSVTPDDVTFPLDSATGQYDLVQLSVYRTQKRDNPISTYIAGLFGMPTADIVATATATAYPANAETCLLPWTIPDKWNEEQCATETCPWGPTDTFDIYAAQGNHQNAGAPLPNPDIYIPPGPPGSPATTGYVPTTDIGVQVVLKPNTSNQVTPSFYNAWDIGGVTGASAYSANIQGCNPSTVQSGDPLLPETGNMDGPTKQGTAGLIALDPNAYWDQTCNGGFGCVKGSSFINSPRIRAIPLYDPVAYANDQHSGKSQPALKVVNFLGFFIEAVDNTAAVTGRIVPITGKVVGGGTPTNGGFARAIMLVK